MEQVGAGRPGTMMDQCADDFDPQLAPPLELAIRPRQVEWRRTVFSRALPQDRVAYSLDSQICDVVQVFETAIVPGFARLVAPLVANAADRAFGTAPLFDLARHVSKHDKRPFSTIPTE